MLSRRRFLTSLAAAGVLGAAGCTLPTPPARPGRERTSCAPRDELPLFDSIGAARLHYEIDGRPRPFRFDPAFHQRLEEWWADWLETSGLATDRIDNYGAWIDGRGSCDSWHHSGRAFDLGRLRNGSEVVVSCREDLWAGSGDEPARRRSYWALAAHLHIHFAYVLTYLFDTAHRTHIHIDNGLSGTGRSTFRAGSRVQVQVVQATARWLFDEPVDLTERLDAATRRAAESVLDSLGRRGGLTSTDNWHAYLRAAAQRGTR